MCEVRALPHFQTSWNGKQPQCGFIVNQSLDACEAKFKKDFAAATRLLVQPLIPEDIYAVGLCLCRVTVPCATQNILRFLV